MMIVAGPSAGRRVRKRIYIYGESVMHGNELEARVKFNATNNWFHSD